MNRYSKMLSCFLLIFSLISCNDVNNLGGNYIINYFGDEREIINSKSNFKIEPRIFYLKNTKKYIFVIQRSPEIKMNLGRNNVVFSDCRFYLIDIHNNKEIKSDSILKIKNYIDIDFFNEIHDEAIYACK
jgi:hypothetical protein